MTFAKFLFVLLALASSADASTLRVATRAVEPFVMVKDGNYAGFSVELWREIARRLGTDTTFILMPDIDGVLGAVGNHTADLGIAAISITADRDAKFDFSQPMFDAGLQILTPAAGKGHSSVITAVMEGIFDSAMLPLLGAVIAAILVPAHLVWWWERRHPQGMFTHRDYFPGIFEAWWWAASTLATQADQMPRAMAARVVALLWMFFAVIFVAYFTASVTSNLTLQQLHGDINGPADLTGKRVVTLAGSTSQEFLKARGLDAQVFESFADAVAALEAGKADAMVFDAPTLMYYAAHEGQGRVQLVGQVFRRENYGVVFAERSPLVKAVNGALLGMQEDGTYDLLYARWFGAR